MVNDATKLVAERASCWLGTALDAGGGDHEVRREAEQHAGDDEPGHERRCARSSG